MGHFDPPPHPLGLREEIKGGNYVQKYGSLDQKSSFQNAALICADQKWIDFYALSFSFWGQFFFFKFKSYLEIIRELLNNNYSMRVSQRATVETNPNELAACCHNG